MRTFTRSLCIACLQYALSLHGPLASAGTVKIEQSADRSVTVIAEDATIAEVVGKLGVIYGFRLDHRGAPSTDATRDEPHNIDGRYQGSLRGVLDRLLTKESYFIEHARESKSGIARVVLYNVAPPSATGLTATRVVPVITRPHQEPVKAAATVQRYQQAPPPASQATVTPIRRVPPAQPPSAPLVRPNVGVPPSAPLKTQAAPPVVPPRS
jgi:hypothetical protein